MQGSGGLTISGVLPQPGELGIVAIGRNEGARLTRCLASIDQASACVVYVDSGSSDGSVGHAREAGARVVELDMSRPFSAARARNAGLEALRAEQPGVGYVQFLDADCELAPDWLARALNVLVSRDDVAVVCGRRHEVDPTGSIYNRLCDLEWDRPAGKIKACGGDALMRVEALEQVGAFNPAVVAGEEPELCFRLRRAGWRIERVREAMTYHDAAMTRFSQWWRRHVRGGHAVGQAMAMHGRSPERFGVRASATIWAWALGPTLMTLGAIGLFHWPGLAVMLVYPAQMGRIALKERQRSRLGASVAALYGIACVMAKWPQLQGQVQWWSRWMRGRQPTLIEYKQTPKQLAG